jgi:spermidine/putrescine transport system substrate-binding protein
MWIDTANAGMYCFLESDDWNLFCICCIAGFDPFKVHSDD